MDSFDRRRKQCEGDIYHVTIRGVGRQIIFEDDCDRRRLKSLLESKCQDQGVQVYAWCFMDNHVHLLLHAPIADISKMMQRAQGAYAKYFNKRHDRVGALFQNRFFSVPIETNEQLMSTVSYIHRNPLELGAGLGYRWSSYREYLGNQGLANTSFVLDVFGSMEAFSSFHEREEQVHPQVFRNSAESKDAWVQAALRSVLGDLNPYDVRAMSKSERNDILRQLKEAGLSIRQIERATSIGRGIISRA